MANQNFDGIDVGAVPPEVLIRSLRVHLMKIGAIRRRVLHEVLLSKLADDPGNEEVAAELVLQLKLPAKSSNVRKKAPVFDITHLQRQTRSPKQGDSNGVLLYLQRTGEGAT